MTALTKWQIGEWTFDAAGGRLVAGETEVLLEYRASQTLELLCLNRGRPVSREDILAIVWGGRAVSANSVAVVIADLRRALGEDASARRLIATVPKRGYRLNEEALEAAAAPPSDPATARFRRPSLSTALVLLFLLVSAFLVAHNRSIAGNSTVLVSPTANDTGQARYAPLATALDALVTARLTTMGLDVIAVNSTPTSEDRKRGAWLQTRLILWNGVSTLSMEAVDDAGHVIWAEMAVAPPNGLASATIARLTSFKAGARSHQ